MQSTVFLAVLVLLQAGNELIERLDSDYEKFVANEPQRERVREAARLLARTDDQTAFGNHAKAVQILRDVRPKAGVPLLLASMVRHSKLNNSQTLINEYERVLRSLVGVSILTSDLSNLNSNDARTNHEMEVRKAVENFANGWWSANQKSFTTRIDNWTDDRLRVLAEDVLLRAQATLSSSVPSGAKWQTIATSSEVAEVLQRGVLEKSSDYAPTWRLEELRPEMMQVFLTDCDYKVNPIRPARDMTRPVYAAIELLAALRANGELDTLDEVANDVNQTVGTRLTCAIALFRAGERIPTSLFRDIAENDKNLERRLVAIHMLGQHHNDQVAGKLLVELLDDENEEIRVAAISAVAGARVELAIPKLRKVLDELDPPQAINDALRSLGNVKSQEAREVLADFLVKALEDGERKEYLWRVIDAFENSTSQRWRPAGALTEESLRQVAREALQWWKKQTQN